MVCGVVIIIMLFHVGTGEKNLRTVKIPVGGIFEGTNEEEELAFNTAIDIINRHKPLSHRYVFEPLSTHVEPENVIDTIQGKVIGLRWDRPFPALESACYLLDQGVVSIFTAMWENSANIIESLCDTKEVPVIRISPDKSKRQECCTINLFPYLPMLSKAVTDLIKYQDWESFTVMYESEDSFINIAEIFKIYNATGHNILIQQLYVDENGDYFDVLKTIRRSKQTKFILHCELENLDKILKQALQVGLMMKRYSYVILSLDMETIDLTQYQHTGTKFISLGLVDQSNPQVQEIVKALRIKRTQIDLEIFDPEYQIFGLGTLSALMVDAVMLFVETLKDVGNFTNKPLSCEFEGSWEHGSTIFNFMKLKTLNGLTGLIHFDHYGRRADFNLDIIELKETGITKIGRWDPNNLLQIFPPSQAVPDDGPFSLKNKHLRVMVAWVEPYSLFKNSTASLKGNDQYEGFAIDLIHELALLEGFNYTFVHNEDDKNGDYNATTRTWNGMIGDILNGRGDIAIGDMAVTTEREQVVDFTAPFMSLGIQILYTKPTKHDPDFFSFAEPFDPKIWLLLAISYFVVSIGLFLMARVCPKEWGNWDPCVTRPKYLINQFTLGNSFWFVIGCLMQQGAEIAPSGASTRVLSSFFAFFILVLVSFYKAQLAAFLTKENLLKSFNNAGELLKRADELGIAYGAVTNEATHKFFQMSQDAVYSKIGGYMDSHPENMVEESYLGVIKVLEGNYAFFMESVNIKYHVNFLCDLTSVGDRINEKYFAIALKKDAPYRNRLSEAILKLQETGHIDRLVRKWWEELLGSDFCTEPPPDTVAPPLNLRHVSGMFWITIIGIVLAFGLAFVELATHVFFKCRKNRQAFEDELKRELRLSFAFNKTVKSLKEEIVASAATESSTNLNNE